MKLKDFFTPLPPVDINELMRTMRDRIPAIIACDWIAEDGPTETAPRYTFSFRDEVREGQDFIVEALRVCYGTMEPKDREEFRESYRLDFSIIDKNFWSGPLAAVKETGLMIPAGPHLIRRNPNTPTQPGDFGAYAKFLAPSMPFKVTIYLDDQHTTVKVKRLRLLPVLCGFLDRPVQ
jgi:hypothetical protein